MFADPQVQHLGVVEEIEHKSAGKIKVVSPPVHYSRTPNSIRLPPPVLNEHTIEILQQQLGIVFLYLYTCIFVYLYICIFICLFRLF